MAFAAAGGFRHGSGGEKLESGRSSVEKALGRE